MLAWLALGGSVLLCLPFGCLNGILAAVSTAALTNPDIETGISAAENTFFAGLFGGLTLLSLVPATALFVWSLRVLRQEG